MKKLIKLALLVGGVAFAAKLMEAKKAEWEGMTEPDVRAKLDARLPEKVPADKRAEIADKIVGKMREKGVLGEEAPASDEAPTSD
ncbi:MAG: hypothetical protein HKN80_06300 [Acidimicrobiia bacterium]|nr:hypothetical protein [Acidimicrobiia bacterium]NNC92085.1 hypothetical protein [Acidimicrobiia bacterium]